MPYPVYTPEVERFRTAIGGCVLIVPFDWMGWDGLQRYHEPADLSEAPVADVVRLLVAIIRSERFGDGNLEEAALQRGLLQAAVSRLHTSHD